MSEKKVDKTAELVAKRWEEGNQFLTRARRDYWLNLAFYQSRQWVTWDDQIGQVRDAPLRINESERVRVTVNKIEPRIDTLLGVLTERELIFEGDPTDADDQSIAGSRLGEDILEATRIQQNWEAIRLETVLNALLGGTSAVAIEWNCEGGERLWVDEGSNKVIGTGECTLVPLALPEFTIEPGSRRWENAKWWIGQTAVPPEQAKRHYNLDWTPVPDANRQTWPTRRSHNQDHKLVMVYVMYERPGEKDKGRQVVVINGKTVVDEQWKLPFNELNIVPFRQGYVPMQWHGKTFMSAARPVQVLYNAARSNIAEHAKLASNNRLFVPNGALDDISVLTDEPGEIVEFHADYGEPRYVAPPGVPKTIVDEIERLEAELDDILHAHDVARGVAPGDRNSGLALSILAEKNNTPLGVMAHDQANGWGRIGSLVLKMYAEVDESREAIVVSDSGVARKYKWSGKDLRGQTEVRVPIDATAPHTRAQMLAQLQNMQQLSPQLFASIPQERMMRLMGLSSVRELTNGWDQDIAKAQRENDRMAAGEVMDPQEHPAEWDDHAKHIAEHNAFRKSTAFEVLPPEIKQVFELHLQAHEARVHDELMGQASMNAIKPGLGALPQAHDPMGSAVPMPFAQQSSPLNENSVVPSTPGM